MTLKDLLQPVFTQVVAGINQIDTEDTAQDVHDYGTALFNFIADLDDTADDTDGTQTDFTPITFGTPTVLDPSTGVVVGAIGATLSDPDPNDLAAITIEDDLTFTGGSNALIAIHEATITDDDGIFSSTIDGINMRGDVAMGSGPTPSIVIASVSVSTTGPRRLEMTGLDMEGAALSMTSASDTILIAVEGDHEDSVSVTGLRNRDFSADKGSSITTGSGRDEIIVGAAATADVDDPLSGDARSTGIYGIGLVIETGSGADEILASADTVGGDFATATGIRMDTDDDLINMGTGADLLTSTAVTDVAGTGVASSFSITNGGLVDMGAGDDTVVLEATGVAGGNMTAVGLSLFLVDGVGLDLGIGDDSLIISSDGTAGDLVISRGLSGNGETVDAGAGADRIEVTATGSGLSNSSDVVGIQVATIELGDRFEEDTDILIATATMTTGGGETDAILFSTVNAGGGDDRVEAIASGGNVSYGIKDSTINLGSGDDIVVARGDTRGVQSSIIFGGAGDDTFDLQSGSGDVIGGSGLDLLILAGDSSAFTWDGTLLSDGSLTSLTLESVESVQFDDGTFAIDDLLIA